MNSKEIEEFRYLNTENKSRIATIDLEHKDIRIGGKGLKALHFVAGWFRC